MRSTLTATCVEVDNVMPAFAVVSVPVARFHDTCRCIEAVELFASKSDVPPQGSAVTVVVVGLMTANVISMPPDPDGKLHVGVDVFVVLGVVGKTAPAVTVGTAIRRD